MSVENIRNETIIYGKLEKKLAEINRIPTFNPMFKKSKIKNQ